MKIWCRLFDHKWSMQDAGWRKTMTRHLYDLGATPWNLTERLVASNVCLRCGEKK